MEQIRIVYKRNIYKLYPEIFELNKNSSSNSNDFCENVDSICVIFCVNFQPNQISSMGAINFFVFFNKIIFVVSNWLRDQILHFWKVHC